MDLWAFLQRVGAALAIALLVFLVYRIAVRGLLTYQERGKLGKPILRVLRKVLRWAAFLLILAAVLQQFGVLEHAWATISGMLALVAIGFVAVWSILSNALCALMLMLTRPFDVGDTIEIVPEGIKGKVVNFSLLFTTLRETETRVIQVPNNTFFQKAIRCEEGDHEIGLDEQLLRDSDAG